MPVIGVKAMSGRYLYGLSNNFSPITSGYRAVIGVEKQNIYWAIANFSMSFLTKCALGER
jgi:hypothetical protein